MRTNSILLTLFASLAAGSTACQQVECADGTVERDGECVAPDLAIDLAYCGPGTRLVADQCVPIYQPTECDPDTTEEEIDPETGFTICLGAGGILPCGMPLASCRAGSTSTKLTICGQLYDFEDNTEFRGPAAMGTRCNPASPTATGPCALQFAAYDAVVFGTNPTTAPKLAIKDVYIDDCGRYRLKDIDINGTGPFIGIGIDDAGTAIGNPAGVTVTVGMAIPKPPERFIRDFEGWIVKASVAAAWGPPNQPAGPPLSGGIYAAIFRKHKKGFGDQLENQAGVKITKSTQVLTANDHYFAAGELNHQTIDPNASMTGANGTGLFTGAKVADNPIYSGEGGLGPGCQWEPPKAAASLAGIVFIQVYRKVGATCND